MFYILSLLFFGFLVGIIAKKVHPGVEPVGIIPSIIAGIVGSFVGGAINYFVLGSSEVRPAGFIMSVIGAIVFFAFLKWISLKNVK